jgi:hypothetical protein
MLDVRATIAQAAAKSAEKSGAAQAAATPSKTPEKAPEKAPEKPADKTPVVAAAQKVPDKLTIPAPAPKAKEPEQPAREAAKKKPELILPDEEPKVAPRKVAAADKAPEPKASPEKQAAEKSSAPAGDGYLRLGSKPWTNITVDGKETGLHTPQTHLKLASGTHRITLINPQFSIKETFSVEIKAGETETVIKDLRPQGGDTD